MEVMFESRFAEDSNASYFNYDADVTKEKIEKDFAKWIESDFEGSVCGGLEQKFAVKVIPDDFRKLLLEAEELLLEGGMSIRRHYCVDGSWDILVSMAEGDEVIIRAEHTHSYDPESEEWQIASSFLCAYTDYCVDEYGSEGIALGDPEDVCMTVISFVEKNVAVEN